MLYLLLEGYLASSGKRGYKRFFFCVVKKRKKRGRAWLKRNPPSKSHRVNSCLRREEQLFSESQRASQRYFSSQYPKLNYQIKMKLAIAALLAGSAAAFNVKEVRFFRRELQDLFV